MVFATDSENTHLYWWYAYDKKKYILSLTQGVLGSKIIKPEPV